MIKNLARILALVSFLSSRLLTIRLQVPGGFILWIPKLLAGAMSPWLAVAGALGALLGLVSRSWLAAGLGALGALASARYVWKVSSQPSQISHGFGVDRWARIPTTQAARLRPVQQPKPCQEKDVAFWTIPGTNRRLLCDLWQPAAGVTRSGLALIYFHGSAWSILDKDFGTRTFFRHLAGQGHVIMDVAYRLSPEADMAEMVGDVKRAIVWMKNQAASLAVDPDRIVLGGGSAGAHLALLAGYAPYLPELTPDDVSGADLSVGGVISFYGPSDLRACYYHMHQDLTMAQSPEPLARPAGASMPANMLRAMLGDSMTRLGFDKPPSTSGFRSLLGGTPDEVPAKYDLLSPISHVHPNCPPTLLIQGDGDLITPVAATRSLASQLCAAGVPVVNIVYPDTDHAFDLILPRVSPTAQAARLEVERFLALISAPCLKVDAEASHDRIVETV